ncbi:MAG: RluA family pseudouridine synthase [Spirochaetia bacterium]|nr:RluA family pseudouridine synthase [Spirochaetia bacterium]
MNRDISEVFTVEIENNEGLRADRYIGDYLQLFTRSQIKHRDVRVLLNNKEIKLSKLLNSGDVITIEYNKPEPLDLIPENMDLDIIFEDKDTLVINKPQGMVVHPGAGNYTGTLVHGLLFHCNEVTGRFSDNDIRPGIVHRLDKDTSGVIILAKNPDALEFLSSQFRNKTTQKFYLAIVKGVPIKKEGIIQTNIARDINNRKKFTVSETRGKLAVSRYKTIESYGNLSLILLGLETGRTHQLRVHMLDLGNPILGDTVYGRKSGMFPEETLMLHAWQLSINLPSSTENEYTKASTFRAPIPDRFMKIIEKFSRDPKETLIHIEKALD